MVLLSEMGLWDAVDPAGKVFKCYESKVWFIQTDVIPPEIRAMHLN